MRRICGALLPFPLAAIASIVSAREEKAGRAAATGAVAVDGEIGAELASGSAGSAGSAAGADVGAAGRWATGAGVLAGSVKEVPLID